MEGYPPEMEVLHHTLSALPGIHGVCSGIDNLEGVSAVELGSPALAHLPHGALRRTDGGLESEVLIQVEFRLESSPPGWRSLEFLAWFVRDRARGDQAIQLRPFALPPVAGDQVQLGDTLRFHLDIFCPKVDEDLAPTLARVRELADGLKLAIELYDRMLREHGAPGLLAERA
jgi:hypothetical protein